MEVVALIGWLCAVVLGGAFVWSHQRAKQLETTLSQLTASNQELGASLQKTINDRDQTVKRVNREAERSVKFSHEPVLKGLLPVLDNLERAVSAADEDAAIGLIAGVRIIGDQFRAELARHGVTPIDAEGVPFDPQTHEAIQRAPSEVHPPGTVLSQWQRGYRLHDRLLRPARVVVACDPADNAADPDEVLETEEAPEEGMAASTEEGTEE